MEQNQTTTLDIEELIPDRKNYNAGTEAGAKLMRKSFEQFGAGRSVLLDKDNNIIAGNKSQKAAIEAGIKRVRIIETDGTELIAVRRTDVTLDSREGRELALADNATQQVNLAWDADVLQDVSQELGIDIQDWGVDTSQFAQEIPEESEAEEDNFNEDKEDIPTICQRGEVWQLGNHRLMCGDSTNQEDVARLMQGEMADLWLTDPPYNVDYSSKNEALNAIDKGNRVQTAIKNDTMSDKDFAIFLDKAFQSAAAIMKSGGAFYVWTAQGHAQMDIAQALDRTRLFFRQQLIWIKTNFVLGRMDYQWQHEPCYYGWKEGAGHYFIPQRNLTTVIEDEKEIDIDKMKKDEMRDLLHRIFESKTPTTVIREKKPAVSKEHPTMKPVRLFGRLIVNSSRQGEIVLDTFGGSGTTIVACEQLNRKARLMELDPHYCDVIIARWEKLTGAKATRITQQ